MSRILHRILAHENTIHLGIANDAKGHKYRVQESKQQDKYRRCDCKRWSHKEDQ